MRKTPELMNSAGGIIMAGRYSRSRGRLGSPRETLWVRVDAVDATFTAVGGTILTASNAAFLALRPFTIIRQYYEIQIRSDQAAAIEQQNFAYGVAVVSDQAAAIGVTAVPTPNTDSGSDLWMLHQFIFGQESNLTDRSQPARQMEVESKAMRKVEDGQTILTIGEFMTTGNGFIATVAGRMLIKTN